MGTEMIVCFFLMYHSICDIRTRKINAMVCVVFGIAGLFMFGIGNQKRVFSLVFGLLIGVGLMVVSYLTRETVGMGDGYVVAAVGIWVGGEKTLAMLMIALFLAAGFGILQISTGKANGKTELAFVPFFTLSHVLFMLGKIV